MSYCAKCGHGLRDGDNFCSKCGTPVGGGVNPQAAPTQYEYCEIKWDNVGGFSNPYIWFAEAIGPQGKYWAAQTKKVSTSGRDSYNRKGAQQIAEGLD